MSDHNHDHEVSDGSDDAPGYYELLEITVRELLIEKQLITAAEIRRQLDVLDSRTPAVGARHAKNSGLHSTTTPA
jgi:nitrile hydratase